MRIGVVPEQGGSLTNLRNAGQDERFIRGYLVRYAQQGVEVCYFSYADESRQLPDGVRLIPNRHRWHRWWYSIAMVWIHRREFRRCSVIRVMQATGAFPAILAKWWWGVPYVVTYGYRYEVNARRLGHRWRPWLFWFRAWLALRCADRVIVTTEALATHVRSYVAADRLVRIPNTADTQHFVPPESRLPGQRVLWVARLDGDRRPDLVVDAVAQVRHRWPGATLTVAGDGTMQTALATRARALGVPVEWCGVVPNEQLVTLYQSATVFVLASPSEGLPKTLVEAMSTGLPSVVTRWAGVEDVHPHAATGMCVEPTADALAGALGELFTDHEAATAIGQRARQRAVDHFDLSHWVSKEWTMLRALAAVSDVRPSGVMGVWWRWSGRWQRVDSWRNVRRRVHIRIEDWVWSWVTQRGRAIRRMVQRRVDNVQRGLALPFPDMLHVEMTNRCNLQCTMCPHPSMARPRQDISWSLYEQLVEECSPDEVDAMAMYYFGESLINEELPRAIQHLNQHRPGIHSRLRTNGQLVTPERAQSLLESGLTSLEWSIDGSGRVSYESIMLGGRYEQLQLNVQSYLHRLRRWKGFHRSLVVTIRLPEMRNAMRAFVRRWARVMPVAVTEPHNTFRTGDPLAASPEAKQRTSPCPDPFYHAVVLSNGDVTVCCADVEGHLSLGNLNDESLRSIWHGPRAQRLRKQHLEGRFDELPLCRHCPSGALRDGVHRR